MTIDTTPAYTAAPARPRPALARLVRTEARLLSPVRIEFSYELVRPSDGLLLAKGHTVHVALDRDGRPCRLPTRVRAIFHAPDVAPV